MAKIYRSAMGKPIDIDQILLKNETVIAVGNMKVNARGDELGTGGRIVKTRDQVMKEYYALNTPTAVDPMDTMQPDEPTPTQAKPRAQVAAVVAAAVAEQVVINPNSGLDDDDEGPAVAPVPQMSIEEVLRQPTPTPAPPKAFVPKEIPVGTPAPAKKIVADAPKSDPSMPQPPVARSGNAMRGSLADSIAKTTTVTQTEKLPPKKANGVQRF